MLSPVSDIERLRWRQPPSEAPLLRQRWCDLAFLHWSVDPARLAPLLPPRIQLDTWEGRAYIGIVPFAIRGTRPPPLPPLPGIGSFPEVNLRTYVHRNGRAPGVWFFSLDAGSRLAVWGARLAYKLPYFFARMSISRGPEGTVIFNSRRTERDGRARFECRYRPIGAAAEAEAGTLAFFLLERYLLYSWDDRLLRSARVWHRPYPIAPGRVDGLIEELTTSAGIPEHGSEPPLVHYARDLDVRIYRPGPVRERIAQGSVPATPEPFPAVPALP